MWDLLAESGKKEVELVKATSGAGFNVPDLTQVGESLPFSTQYLSRYQTCLPSARREVLVLACALVLVRLSRSLLMSECTAAAA